MAGVMQPPPPEQQQKQQQEQQEPRPIWRPINISDNTWEFSNDGGNTWQPGNPGEVIAPPVPAPGDSDADAVSGEVGVDAPAQLEGTTLPEPGTIVE